MVTHRILTVIDPVEMEFETAWTVRERLALAEAKD
jgi:hypothetical protein